MEVNWESAVEADQLLLMREEQTHAQKHELRMKQCEEIGFQPPLTDEEITQKQWRYVSLYTNKVLKNDEKLLTETQLAEIPRRHSKLPFCRPGPDPLTDRKQISHFYFADSIVQQITLKSDAAQSYVVRWVGYEDSFNTVEPFVNVKNSAVYELYTHSDIFTANRANGVCVIPKSELTKNGSQIDFALQISAPDTYQRTIRALNVLLHQEQLDKRYKPELGFYS